MIPSRSDLCVLVVSTVAGIRLNESRPPTRGREQVIDARDVDKTILLVAFYVSVTYVSTKPVHLSRTMVIARGGESPTLEENLIRPSEPTSDGSAVHAVYKLIPRKYLQMPNHEDVRKMALND